MAEPFRGSSQLERENRRARCSVCQPRRIHAQGGEHLQSRRGEKIERNSAHQFDKNGMDLPGLENVSQAALLQVAACNLALLLRGPGMEPASQSRP